MRLIYTDGYNSDFIMLCHMLDAYLNETVGGEKNRSQYINYNTLEDIQDVVLVYDKDVPVGCAAFKYYEENTAEVKRVFLKEDCRGKGISKQLMIFLEQRAKKKGFHKLVLESGNPLVEAMGLYYKMGFKVIKNYGPYKCMNESICMEKFL